MSYTKKLIESIQNNLNEERDLEKIPSSLYNKILEIVEEYQEALENDEDDVFGGTEDSYANELLEDRLADLFYDSDFKMYVSEHWDTTTKEDKIKSMTFVLNKLADAIRTNTLSKYKSGKKMSESDNSKPVKVLCYGEVREFPTRQEAIDFYDDCIDNSEGAEQERYSNIYLDLTQTDKDFVYDYEDEYKEYLNKNR